MLYALNGQNAGQIQFVHLFGKERNGFKAGFGFGGAAHKGGIVAQTVIVHQIAERAPGFIHAKNFVCDDKFAVCGTINMDYRSLVHHFECGAWMYGTECIADMKEDFLNTLAVSEKVTEEKAKLHLWERLPAELMKVFTPLL